MKITNVTGMTGAATQYRNQSAVKRIAIHWSGTATGDWTSFSNYWRNSLGWHTAGYHELIALNGDVTVAYPPTTITNGVGGQNHDTYNICYVGNTGQPTAAQLASLENRVRHWMKVLNIPRTSVLGHREFPNQATACPGLNMTTFRNRLATTTTNTTSTQNLVAGDLNRDVRVTSDTLNVRSQRNATSSIVRTLKRGDVVRIRWVLGINGANPIGSSDPWGAIEGGTGFINMNFVELVATRRTHTVVSGNTLWGLSQTYGVTVDAIRVANNLKSDTLSIGQVITIP